MGAIAVELALAESAAEAARAARSRCPAGGPAPWQVWLVAPAAGRRCRVGLGQGTQVERRGLRA
eukprot:13840300-Alexandrium_andersonii.AAC.1